MTEDDKWDHLLALDDELLLGGVILSEWCALLIRETDTAFVKGAHLAAILTAVAAIETYLRSGALAKTARLATLIDEADILQDLKRDLHELRVYRNRWVHVDEPWNDQQVLSSPEIVEKEVESMALLAVRALRQVVYSNQWL